MVRYRKTNPRHLPRLEQIKPKRCWDGRVRRVIAFSLYKRLFCMAVNVVLMFHIPWLWFRKSKQFLRGNLRSSFKRVITRVSILLNRDSFVKKKCLARPSDHQQCAATCIVEEDGINSNDICRMFALNMVAINDTGDRAYNNIIHDMLWGYM